MKIEIVRFSLIGKNSPAHIVTFEIKTKKRKIEKILNYADIKNLAMPNKKK